MNTLKTALSSALTLLVLASASAVGAWTLDRQGTGPETPPGYFCRNPFEFKGMTWNKQYSLFTIAHKGQCGVIQDPSQYMPGWGGGAADFKNVDIAGVFTYDDGDARETVRHEGKIILDTHLHCDRNPWLYPYEVACTVAPSPAPINNSGVKIDGPYPVSARYVESSAIIAMRKWEEDKDKPDPLADWDPYATPAGYSALSISSPTSYQSIDAAAPGFSLALNGIPPGSTARVLMNWQNIVQGPEWAGDIHLSEEARWDWLPFTGPPFAPAGSFPFTVTVNPGFFAGKPGLYRLQTKLEPEQWWSRWRYFWIGPAQADIPHQDQIIAASAFKMKAALGKKITTLDATSAERLLKPTRPTGSPVPSSGAPASPPAAKTPLATPLPAAKTPIATPAAMQTTSTRVTTSVVTLESVGFKPAPLVAGSAVDVILNFKNGGVSASDPSLKYTLSCKIKSGGPICPVPNTTRPVSTTGIGPGMTASQTLAGAAPAEAGNYELTVAIGNARGKVFSFNVAGAKIKLEMQPRVQPKALPTTQPQLQPQTPPQRMESIPNR